MSQPGEKLLTPIQDANTNPYLEFRDGQHLFVMRNQEGALVERFISNAAVREAFSGIPIDSGWIRPEIARWGDGRHGEWAIAFMPPAVYELEITNESPEGSALERLHVPLPGLVWLGLSQQYYVWAVKSEKLEPYHDIFRAPLPNVYADGKICWGMVRPPNATARTLFDAWELFIKSTFNNHLASGKSKRERDDVRIVLRDVAQKYLHPGASEFEPKFRYPKDDLVRQVDHVGITLDAAIRQFFESGEMPS